MDREKVSHFFKKLMTEGLGLDMSDPNLSGTPNRIAKMYCNEFFWSVGKEFTDFQSFPNEHGYDQIVVSDTIFFVSYCAHHFLPFTGNAWVLYVPKDFLIGASKPARLINHYAARPQLQENLCHEVINAFNKGIEPSGCMVVIRGIHQCMKCRGAKQYGGAGMICSAVTGLFREDPTMKQEGFELIKLSLLDRER